MKNILILAFALCLIFIFSVAPLAKTIVKGEASLEESTPDLDIKDGSDAWIYYIFAAGSLVVALAATLVVTKKIKK